ncbi:MAG: hypothetical protein OHK0039_19630 [Bacteroidia bacterium]
MPVHRTLCSGRRLPLPYAVLLLLLLSLGSGAAAQDKTDPAAMQARAYRLAWSQQYAAALQVFDSLLAFDPHDRPAQTGRAYTLAWQGDYRAAALQFGQLLSQDADDWEARKGLAYVALWSGQGRVAVERFEALRMEGRDSDELCHALGMAYLRTGSQVDARSQAGAIGDAARAGALQAAIQAERARLELMTWGGWTRVGTHQALGLRAAQLSWTPQPDRSLWVRFDNTLGLDNAALYLRDSAAMAAMIGGTWQPVRRWSVQAEAGRRWLPGQAVQHLLLLEQTWFVHRRLAWKGGIFAALGARGGADQALLHTGASWHAGGNWWLEPTVFVAWSGGFDQTRLALAAKYHRPRGHEWAGGLLGGVQQRREQGDRLPVFGGWLQYQHPLLDKHWVYLAGRYETAAEGPFANISVGLRFRIED